MACYRQRHSVIRRAIIRTFALRWDVSRIEIYGDRARFQDVVSVSPVLGLNLILPFHSNLRKVRNTCTNSQVATPVQKPRSPLYDPSVSRRSHR